MPTLQDYSDTRLHLFDGLDAEEVEAVADGAGGVVTEEQAGVFEWFGIGFENGLSLSIRAIPLTPVIPAASRSLRANSS